MSILTEIGIKPSFIGVFEKAKILILQSNKIYVTTHNDIDGLASAGNLVNLLKTLGKPFKVIPRGMLGAEIIDEIEEISSEYDLLIFADIGSFFLTELSVITKNKIILDHHEIQGVPDDLTIHINPLLFDEGGIQNCCGSVLTYLLYISIFPEALKKALPLMIGGVLGDKQDYYPGESNLKLFRYLESKNLLLRIDAFFFKYGRLIDLISTSLYPFFPKFLFSESKVRRFLTDNGFNIDDTYESLDEKGRETFQSLVRELSQHFRPEVKAIEERKKFYLVAQDLPGENLLDLFRVYENSKFNKDLFLNIDPTSTRSKHLIQGYYRQLIPLLKYIFSTIVIKRREFFSYAVITKGPMSIISELLHRYFYNSPKILFLFKIGTLKIKYSSRCDKELVDRGLNLSEACSLLGTFYGGQGGGHKIAAGGQTVTSSIVENISFLDKYFLAKRAIIKPLSP